MTAHIITSNRLKERSAVSRTQGGATLYMRRQVFISRQPCVSMCDSETPINRFETCTKLDNYQCGKNTTRQVLRQVLALQK